SSRRRHTSFSRDWSSDVCSSDLEGMKCSLVSREVIADSIETVGRGQSMDAMVVVGGCDKNMPGGMIALARLDVPSVYVYGGTIKIGRASGGGGGEIEVVDGRVTQ